VTYYQHQVLKIKKLHFPKDIVITQLVNAKRFIDENYADRINLELIAGFSFLSKFHFTRLFLRCYGMTPHQYLIEQRVSAAKQLLAAGMSVTETCFEIGFISQPSFSSIFKKHTGLTPSEFKNSNFQYAA